MIAYQTMITVLIPTRNRPLCIRDIILYSLNKYNGDLFCFQIHDSSDSEETKKIIDEFSKANVKYIKHDSKEDFFEKSINSIKHCNTEYFYLLGDGNIVDFNKLENDLLKNNYLLFDLIGIFNKPNINDTQTYESNELLAFSEKYFTHLTYWGFSIIKKEIINPFLAASELKLFDNDTGSWWIASSILKGLLRFNGRSLILFERYISVSKNKNGHSWTNGERYYQLAFSALNKVVFELPSFFNDSKIEMIRQFRKDELATRRFLIYQRGNGTLTYKLNVKYKKDIKVVKGYYFFMTILSFIPSFAIRIGLFLRRKIR